MTDLQQRIVVEARSYLGVRWLHQGRTREGIDCIGLPILVAQKVFGTKFDATGYARQASDETMLRLCKELLARVPRNALEPGDVLVFGMDNQRHAAVVGDYPHPGEVSIIHAYAPSRKVVEQRLEETWRSRILGAFRFDEEKVALWDRQ